jgi:hypothetical protein
MVFQLRKLPRIYVDRMINDILVPLLSVLLLALVATIFFQRGVTATQIFEFDNSTWGQMTVTTPENFDKESPRFPPIGEWREWLGIISRPVDLFFRPQCIFYAFSGDGDAQLIWVHFFR